MAVKLHRPGYEHARRLVADGAVVLDDRDEWSEHQPSAAEENAFIDEHGYAAYGRWHLAIDDERRPDTKGRYTLLHSRDWHVTGQTGQVPRPAVAHHVLHGAHRGNAAFHRGGANRGHHGERSDGRLVGADAQHRLARARCERHACWRAAVEALSGDHEVTVSC